MTAFYHTGFVDDHPSTPWKTSGKRAEIKDPEFRVQIRSKHIFYLVFFVVVWILHLYGAWSLEGSPVPWNP